MIVDCFLKDDLSVSTIDCLILFYDFGVSIIYSCLFEEDLGVSTIVSYFFDDFGVSTIFGCYCTEDKLAFLKRSPGGFCYKRGCSL